MCKTIKQKVHFQAPPSSLYKMLADSLQHTKVIGKRSSISKKVGGKFKAGTATGINVDLVPGKRIVQAWRDENFPSGIFSLATFNFKKTQNNGTELTLIHRGVPKDLIPGIETHWRQDYWQKIKVYLLKIKK